MKKLSIMLWLSVLLWWVAFANLSYEAGCVPDPTHLCWELPWTAPAPEPVVTPAPTPTPEPNSDPVKPPIATWANLYINYESTAWHKIYAQGLYEGKANEVVDLSQFKKDLVTFEFDHYKPSDGKVSLIAGRHLNGTLVYRKKTPPAKDSSALPQPSTSSSQQEASTQIDLESPQAKMISGIFDNFFQKKNLNKSWQQVFLMSVKEIFEGAYKKLSPSEQQHASSYLTILAVIDSYL